MRWAYQIRNLLDTRDVVVATVGHRTIIGHYQMAIAFGRDATNHTVSTEGRVLMAYTALHHCADALVALHGLQVKPGRSHHRNLYLVATHLNISGVGRLDEDAKAASESRTKSAYDVDTNSDDELRELLALFARLHPIVLRELREKHRDACEDAGLL